MKPVFTGRSYQCRALRPIRYWVVVTLLLLGWQYHRTQGLEARVRFSVTLEGKEISWYDAYLNETGFADNQASGLGPKTLKLVAPNAEPFETNFFVWYGGISLGPLKLEHSRGTLELDVAPASNRVTIAGQQFRKEIQDCARQAVSIPIGDYEIQTAFERFSVKKSITVRRNDTQTISIKPSIASLEISSEPSQSQFRLEAIGPDKISIELTTPATIASLPVGQYQLTVWRDDYRQVVPVYLSSEPTNRIAVRFDYANVAITSEPLEALVFNNKADTKTPASLSLAPGSYRFRVEKEGHYATNIDFKVKAGESREFHVVLENIAFAETLEKARSAASQSRVDYAQAIAEVDKALGIKPNDQAASKLRSTLILRRHLDNAKQLRIAGKYTDALAAVGSALRINQNDGDALALQTVLKTEKGRLDEKEVRAAEADARDKAETRRKRPLEVFHQTAKTIPHDELFEEQIMQVNGSLETVVAGVIRALSRNPEWTTGRNQTPDSEIEIIQAERKFLGMKYNAVLVATQTADNQVTIYYKIPTFIFGGKIQIGLSGISGGGYVPFHPQHASAPADVVEKGLARQLREFKKRIEEELR